jgi:salicylate hydroxylase
MKAGHRVEIYEQAPQLAEVGAGIQISANAMHVLRYLGLGDAIARVGVSPRAYVFRLHDTGEVIQRFPLSDEHERMHGAPYIQLHRADFHEILATGARNLDPDVVRLNHKVVGFSEGNDGVQLRFADGSTAHGDLLIGADGLKSAVRAQILGAGEATYTGDGAWRITVPVERLPPDFLEQAMSVFMGPGGHAVCYRLRGRSLNFVGLVETDEISEESWTVKFSWVEGGFRGWHPSFKPSLMRLIRTNATAGRCTIGYPRAGAPILRHCWVSPAPNLPYLAQGAAMAIEDGQVLTGTKQDGYVPRLYSFTSATASIAPRAS